MLKTKDLPTPELRALHRGLLRRAKGLAHQAELEAKRGDYTRAAATDAAAGETGYVAFNLLGLINFGRTLRATAASKSKATKTRNRRP